jgi:diacylglycerol O-acyltransferase / wax synthase
MSARTEVRMRELDAFSPLHLSAPKWVVDPDFDLSWHVRRVRAEGPPLSGAPVEGFYSYNPTGGSAVSTTLISYRGVCNVGVNIDTAAVHDPEVPLDCLRHSVEEVLELPGAHAPVRLPLREAREAPAA